MKPLKMLVPHQIQGMVRIADVVSQAADTVKQLGKSSNQIGEIIQVIDDIADQTNLLALNAAIEAARAGEMGRGFAVVADEVRKLAERTTKATKEIAVMIKQIQKDTTYAVESIEKGTQEVESGKSLTNKAGNSLKEIISASNKVVDDVNQVTSASEEQSSTAEQISTRIESISNVSDESAAGIQMIAKSAEDLNRLTENLQNLISGFNIQSSNKDSNYYIRHNGKLLKN
ncbi:MAG: methyl-accepting chemotaxis protein [Ignavibacteriaceae bacterium]